VPLLAHPERYSVCSVPLVRHWKERGALMQVDASTLFHPTGRGRRARELLAAGLADVLAADNHGDTRSLAAPFERLASAGGTAATQLMVTNPAAILANDVPETVAPVQVRLPLRGRLKTWLGGFRNE
jgi:tyrosine-protein phosphatase YwqE